MKSILLLVCLIGIATAVNVPIKRDAATGTMSFTLPTGVSKIDGKMAKVVYDLFNYATSTLNNGQTQGYAEGSMSVSANAKLVNFNIAGTTTSFDKTVANGQAFLQSMQTLDLTLQAFIAALGKF